MKVFIGCGSNPDIKKGYLEETKLICDLLCQKGYDLVFGSYSKGMMGVCYNTFIKNKRLVYGMNLEIYNDDLINLEKEKVFNFKDTFTRLKETYNLSDVFIILPGGTGTISELFGIMEEMKNNKTDKKIIVYNYLNYYDNLFKIFDNSDFIYSRDKDNLIIVNNLKDLERVI
jgi:uncharacterized protein (TIGR00730 family)